MEDQPSSLAVPLKIKTADNISKQSENDNRKEIESEKKPKIVKKKYQFGISFQSESDKQRFFELIKSLKAKNGVGVKESTRDLLFRALDALKVARESDCKDAKQIAVDWKNIGVNDKENKDLISERLSLTTSSLPLDTPSEAQNEFAVRPSTSSPIAAFISAFNDSLIPDAQCELISSMDLMSHSEGTVCDENASPCFVENDGAHFSVAQATDYSEPAPPSHSYVQLPATSSHSKNDIARFHPQLASALAHDSVKYSVPAQPHCNNAKRPPHSTVAVCQSSVQQPLCQKNVAKRRKIDSSAALLMTESAVNQQTIPSLSQPQLQSTPQYHSQSMQPFPFAPRPSMNFDHGNMWPGMASHSQMLSPPSHQLSVSSGSVFGGYSQNIQTSQRFVTVPSGYQPFLLQSHVTPGPCGPAIDPCYQNTTGGSQLVGGVFVSQLESSGTGLNCIQQPPRPYIRLRQP